MVKLDRCTLNNEHKFVVHNTNLRGSCAEREWRHIANLWTSFTRGWVGGRTANRNGSMATTRCTTKKVKQKLTILH